MLSEKDKDEIRLVVVDALKREMKSIEIDVSESDVMKHAGPAIEAKKAELEAKVTEVQGNMIRSVDTRLGECTASLGEQVVLAMHKFDEMLQGHFEKIEALISGVEPEKKPTVAAAVRKIAPVASSKGSPALKFLETYVSPGCAYKPTMLLGGQGSGKTTAAKQFAYGAGFGKVVTLYGSRAIEAAALIGRVLPLEGGGTVWQDGKVALAFRYASQGIPTALLIDEYYRILPGDRSPLIPALSAFADPTDGVEYYELTTDRVRSVKDGLALEEEVIRAPRHLLTILATSNIGAAFDVHTGDPAEASRWLTYDMESTSENAKYILNQVIASKSWDKETKVAHVATLIKILEKGNEMRKNHFLELAPDVRILADAIKISEKPTHVGRSLLHLGLQWVGHTIDGRRNPEQYEKFKKLISDNLTIEKL